jgi:hypothetical protein
MRRDGTKAIKGLGLGYSDGYWAGATRRASAFLRGGVLRARRNPGRTQLPA